MPYKDPTRKRKQSLYLDYSPASEKHYAFHQAFKTTRRILCGGVGSSKSYPACYDILAHLLANPQYRGKTALVVSLTEQHAREQLLLIFKAILSGRKDGRGYIQGKHYGISLKPLRIDLWASGSKIIFHSLESNTLAGFNVSLAFADEIDKTSESTWNEIFNRISRENTPGFIIGTCNPANRSHWLAKRYFAAYEDDGIMPENTWFEQLTIYDNPHVQHKWRDWEEQYAYSPLLKQRMLLGKFVSMEGLVFSNFDREKHLFNQTDGLGTRGESIKQHWSKYRGLDFGVSDSTAAVWVAHDPAADCFYVYREYKVTGSSPSQNAKDTLKPSWAATPLSALAGRRGRVQP
jgi:PBSX family phage terminase large subunit